MHPRKSYSNHNQILPSFKSEHVYLMQHPPRKVKLHRRVRLQTTTTITKSETHTDTHNLYNLKAAAFCGESTSPGKETTGISTCKTHLPELKRMGGVIELDKQFLPAVIFQQLIKLKRNFCSTLFPFGQKRGFGQLSLFHPQIKAICHKFSFYSSWHLLQVSFIKMCSERESDVTVEVEPADEWPTGRPCFTTCIWTHERLWRSSKGWVIPTLTTEPDCEEHFQDKVSLVVDDLSRS